MPDCVDSLQIPATIVMERLPSVAGSLVPYGVYLNGTCAGQLFDGGTLELSTVQADNVLDLLDPAGHAAPTPFRFRAMDGASVHAVFRAGRFLLKQCYVSAPTLDERNARRAALEGQAL